MKTRDKLAAALREVAMKSGAAKKYEVFAQRAETGEFDDFGDMYDCPITQLYNELHAAGLHAFAKRVANGEFDATREESDEWAASPSGQEAMSQLSPALRDVLMGKK